MRNLYSMTRNREAILRLFRISDNRAPNIGPQPSIFPAYSAPVIRRAADGERELSTMIGASCYCNRARHRRVINVRDDKILTSKLWKPSFEARRCLVPASSYCEPNGQKPAAWYWFAVNGQHDCSRFPASGSVGMVR